MPQLPSSVDNLLKISGSYLYTICECRNRNCINEIQININLITITVMNRGTADESCRGLTCEYYVAASYSRPVSVELIRIELTSSPD